MFKRLSEPAAEADARIYIDELNRQMGELEHAGYGGGCGRQRGRQE